MADHVVAVVTVEAPDVPLWDMYGLGIVSVVFGVDHHDLAAPWYQLKVCAPGGRQTTQPDNWFRLHARLPLESAVEADTVMVPAVPQACVDGEQQIDDTVLDVLRAAHDRGARVVSMCTGAFALATAGLLDGRRATCHWEHTAQLRRRFPRVTVDDSVLYVDAGQVLTGAGLSAGLDLCLHLVAQDHGTAVANRLAQRLVVPMHRSGGHAQVIGMPIGPTGDADLEPALEWAQTHLAEPITVADLAHRAGLGVRTFQRRLLSRTGSTSTQWLLHARLNHAKTLLETTKLAIDHVGHQSGFGSANTLRHHFRAHVGVSPTSYRRLFSRQ